MTNQYHVGTITLRTESVLCELSDIFRAMYSKEDFIKPIQDLEKARHGSARNKILGDIYDKLDDCQIEYEYGMDAAYYAKLIREDNTLAKDSAELKERMIQELRRHFKDYSAPETYMERILNRLQDNNDLKKWRQDSLRLRILKQFVKYGNYLKDAGYGGKTYLMRYARATLHKAKGSLTNGEVADCLQEDIFAEFDLPNASGGADYKSDRKFNGCFGLLKLCDDLAYGKFRTQGGSKKGLYYLAMVLDMKLAGFEGADEKNDLMKNLFRDYYENNLMRYMTDAYKGNLCQYEIPSGLGINFKNFAEMVYLYYIAKNELTAEEKIRCSEAMIEELEKTASENRQKHKALEKKKISTIIFRGRYIKKEMENGHEIFVDGYLTLPEEEFQSYILQHYNCDTQRTKTQNGRESTYTVGILQIDEEQNTAYETYLELKKQLYRLGGTEGLDLFIDDIQSDDSDNFFLVMKGAGKMIKDAAKDSKDSTFRIREAKDVTRSALMAVYYYIFVSNNMERKVREWVGFKECFEIFKQEMDPMLEKCGYQPVNGKSLFDLILIFSAYSSAVL